MVSLPSIQGSQTQIVAVQGSLVSWDPLLLDQLATVCVRSGVSWRVGKWVGVLVHVLMLLFLLCWLCGPNVSLKSLKLKFLYNSLIHSAHGFRQRFQGIHLCSIIGYGLRLEESSV